MPWRLLLLAFLALMVGCSENKPADNLQIPEKVTIYSLDPDQKKVNGEANPGETFHGYLVLGKIDVKERGERGFLMGALRVAMGPHSVGSKCFDPRHGIRVVDNGKTIDYVISFDCSSYDEYFGGGNEARRGAIDMEMKETFDKPLIDAGIKIAPK